MTTDPATYSGNSFYLGFLSNIGILFWMIAAAICIFTASLLDGKMIKQFLYISGAFTFLLATDDLLLLHEDLLPLLGIPEVGIYIAYILFVFWFLFDFIRK